MPEKIKETETMYRRKGAAAKSALNWARATSLDIAKAESSKKIKAVEEEVASERSAVSSARSLIIHMFGDRTPSEIFSSMLASVDNNKAAAGERMSEVAGKILKNLAIIRNAIRILEVDISKIPLTITKGKEFAQLPGILSMLKEQYEKAFASVNNYIAYWEFVQQNGALPSWYKFGFSRYSSQKISFVINSIFVAEERTTQKLFQGLDVLYKEIMRGR